MKVFRWADQRHPAVPRAIIQRGDCTRGHCRQFSISISNGEWGLTIRFESEEEFRQFFEEGEATQSPLERAAMVQPEHDDLVHETSRSSD
jgi:hypothetical protein